MFIFLFEFVKDSNSKMSNFHVGSLGNCYIDRKATFHFLRKLFENVSDLMYFFQKFYFLLLRSKYLIMAKYLLIALLEQIISNWSDK